MPDNKEKLPVDNQNESLADSKKIDLYINSNEASEQGISIMNIFSFMKKRFHIFIYIMLITLIIGLLVPLMIYNVKDKNESAISILGLDYNGAEQGLAPNGSNLDISYLKSSYIVQNALKNVVLSKNVTVAQVQSNISITGVLTDETKQQKEILDKLAADKSAEYAKLIQGFSLQYRAQYIITLDNGFKDNNHGKKIMLSSNDLSYLLTAITDSYAKHFNDTYQDHSLPNNYIGAIDTESLDYLNILDEVSNSLTYLENYCNDKATYIPGFRTSDGLSFDDLSSMIHTIKNSDVDYIYSYIYLNNVSKDRDMQLTNYKYQKREATLELSEVNESITTVQNSIEHYKTDKIVISTTDSNQTTTVDVTSDYYNELVLELTSLNERKSSLQERIAVLDNRITKLEGTPATEEQVAKAATYVDNALANANSLYNIVYNHSEELFNSNAYQNQYMHSITTYEGDSLRSHVKMFAIGAIAGLLIGPIIWAVDGFILEVKSSNRRNEEREVARNEK